MAASDRENAAGPSDAPGVHAASGKVGLRDGPDMAAPVSATAGKPEDTPRASSLTRVRHVPGEPGIWIFLFGDMLLFMVIFAFYLDHRIHNTALFSASQDRLDRSVGAVNTLVLLSSSILIVFALRALRSKRLWHMASWLTVAGAAIGACFIAIKAFEYHEMVSAGITPSTNEFYMYYFVLTGLHLAHVVIGLAVLTALWWLARKPEPSSTHIAIFEGGACFWHMVDLLWIVIFPLLFLVR